MTDKEAKELLRLLHQYVTNVHPDGDYTITELAEDCVMSLDDHDEEAAGMLDEIKSLLEA